MLVPFRSAREASLAPNPSVLLLVAKAGDVFRGLASLDMLCGFPRGAVVLGYFVSGVGGRERCAPALSCNLWDGDRNIWCAVRVFVERNSSTNRLERQRADGGARAGEAHANA